MRRTKVVVGAKAERHGAAADRRRVANGFRPLSESETGTAGEEITADRS